MNNDSSCFGRFLEMLKSGSTLTLFPSPFGEGCQTLYLLHQLWYSNISDTAMISNYSNVELEEQKFGIAMQHRSFSTWRRRVEE